MLDDLLNKILFIGMLVSLGQIRQILSEINKQIKQNYEQQKEQK